MPFADFCAIAFFSQKIKVKVRVKKKNVVMMYLEIYCIVLYCPVHYGLVIQKTFISDLQAVVSIATYPTFYYELVMHSVPVLKLQ